MPKFSIDFGSYVREQSNTFFEKDIKYWVRIYLPQEVLLTIIFSKDSQ